MKKGVVSGENIGKVTMRENLCMFILKGQKSCIWEEEAVCSRAHKSELYPLTASRLNSQGLTEERRLG